MGVTVTVKNDMDFEVKVAVHLKVGARLCSTILQPGEKWEKTDGGLSAACPYDLRVRKIGVKDTIWVRHFLAPPMQQSLDIPLSMVCQREFIKQRVPVGLRKKMHERAPIAVKWVKDEARDCCARCKRYFNIYWRKHHCRICGDIYCDECSRFQVLTALHPTLPARACYSCYETHAAGEKDGEGDQESQAALSDGKHVDVPSKAKEEEEPCECVADEDDDEGFSEDDELPYITTEDNHNVNWELQHIIGEFGIVMILIGGMILWLFILALLWIYAETVSVYTGVKLAEGFWLGCFVGVNAGSIALTITLLVMAYKSKSMEGTRGPLIRAFERVAGFLRRSKTKLQALVFRRKSNGTSESNGKAKIKGKSSEAKAEKDRNSDRRVQYTKEEARWILLGDKSAEDLWDWSISNDGWHLKRGGDVEVWQREKANGGIKAFKSIGKIPVSAEKLFHLMNNTRATTKWNKALKEYRVLRKLCNDMDIIYAVGAAAGPISARDFVQIRVIRRLESDSKTEEGKKIRGFVLGGYGIKERLVAEHPGIVRGFNYTNGYVILEGKGDEGDKKGEEAAKDNANGSANEKSEKTEWCRLVWVMNADLKGWLPASVVAATMTGVMVAFYDNDLKAGLELNVDPPGEIPPIYSKSNATDIHKRIHPSSINSNTSMESLSSSESEGQTPNSDRHLRKPGASIRSVSSNNSPKSPSSETSSLLISPQEIYLNSHRSGKRPKNGFFIDTSIPRTSRVGSDRPTPKEKLLERGLYEDNYMNDIGSKDRLNPFIRVSHVGIHRRNSPVNLTRRTRRASTSAIRAKSR